MHLRTKLTLLYTGMLGLVLVIITVLLLFATSHTLYKEVDQSIAAKGNSLVNSIIVNDRGFSLRELVLPNVNVFATPDTYLQIMDSRGRVISRSNSLGEQYLPLSEYTLQKALLGESFYETVLAGGQQIRVYIVPLMIDGQLGGLLQVGRTLSTVHVLINRLRFYIAMVGSVSLFLSAILGFLLARAALSPLEKISNTAASIENDSDLSKRIDYNGPTDELGRMVKTLNAMLDRLETTYQQLQQSYELQRRFVSDASHELRTPLTTIRGNAELLQKMHFGAYAHNPVVVTEALNDIADEARRLTRLVGDLLMLARADAGFMPEKETVVLSELLQKVIRKARFLADNRDIIFREDYPVEVMVRVNEDYFSQLIFILLDNAFKYSPSDSTVELNVTKTDNGWVEINFADEGPGLSAGDEERIFDRFYRGATTRGQEGSGLGLAIARWIVEKHMGEIKAANRSEGGSVFTVRLPLAKA